MAEMDLGTRMRNARGWLATAWTDGSLGDGRCQPCPLAPHAELGAVRLHVLGYSTCPYESA